MTPPPAPWTCRCEAILWLARLPREARQALPAPLAERRPLGVLGGVVRYRDTPVGPYDEVFASLGLRHGRGVAGHIPLMAVDSTESVAGGRANWALPKVLAQFSGELGSGIRAVGDGWSIAVGARAAGPPLPARTVAVNVQVWPDGVARSAMLRLRGRMRPAVVSVESDHPLLRPGRRPGAVLTDATFVLGVPRPG